MGGLLAPVGLLLVALGSVCRLGSALAFGGVRLGAAMGRLLPWGHVADGCCRLLVTVLWMFGCVRCVWPRWIDSGVMTCVWGCAVSWGWVCMACMSLHLAWLAVG